MAEWWPTDGEHEVAFAIELFTLDVSIGPKGKETGEGWKAKFDTRRYLTGTVDYLRRATDTHYDWLDDLKTGRWVSDVRKSAQLRSYALLPWIQDGRKLSWRGAVSFTQWERYPLAALPKRTEHILTGLDMAEHLESLRYALVNPDEVNVVDTTTDRRGRTDVMSPCAFCPCRETHPASSWMQHWKHSRLPLCMPGIISRIE